jgi:hypothetical protein
LDIILFTSALVGGEWSALRPDRFTPGERAPGTHWLGGWVDPRTGLDDVEKRKFLTLPGLELRSLGRPARSQSLYRLRYPGSLFFTYNREILQIALATACPTHPEIRFILVCKSYFVMKWQLQHLTMS